MKLYKKQFNLLRRIDSRGTAGSHGLAVKTLLNKGLVRYGYVGLVVTTKGNAILQGRKG